MAVRNYSDLIVWQKAMDLAEEIYRVTESFPRREVFGISNQMRRAAVSVPSNIAEGQGRATTKDFCQFLHVAKGSLQELETQILLSIRLKFVREADRAPLLDRTAEVARILNGLISSLAR
jgi:four helix bundle protein